MDQILDKLHRRKNFYIVVVLLCIILLCIRYFILPDFNPTLKKTFSEGTAGVLDSALISLIVTVFVGSFVFWLTPDVVRTAKVEVVEPREIGDLFTDALRKSDLWWYSGGCGRFFRAKTLPEMAREARKRSLTREVNALIIDPSDESLCQNYANYRRGVHSAIQENPWTVKRVRQELIATIIKTAIITHEEPLLRIKLSLVNHFSSIRFDLSSEYVILTKEDKQAPAIRLDAGTYFYRWYRDEMVLTESQARAVPKLAIITTIGMITPQDIKTCLPALQLSDDYFNEQELIEIVNLCQNSRSPYE